MELVTSCRTRIGFALISAAALVGCVSEKPITNDQANTECRVYRNALSNQAYADVMGACTRRLGEEFCRKCLP